MMGPGIGQFGRLTALVSMLAGAAFVSGCRIEIEDEGDSNVQGTVERMLEESAGEWNRGELDGFMDDYVQSENTTYIGGGGLLTGYESIRARYAPLFEPGAERDSLRFEDVKVRRLAAVEAIATARWILHRGGTVTGSGPFTLVLRHTSGGWRSSTTTLPPIHPYLHPSSRVAENAVAGEAPAEHVSRTSITDELLAACVHCGFCVPVCPTWDILREENDSPRGRLYLMRAEAEGRVDPAGAFSVHLGRCLGCRACESACPAGVPYGHLLEGARARIPERPGARRRKRWLLSALTDPRVSGFTYTMARLFRSRGLAGALGRNLPGRIGQMLRLLAATRPTFGPAGVQPTSASSGRPPKSGSDTASYALLTGCVMDGLFSHIHDATRRTLARAGYREVEAPEQVCCGALHAHAGLLEEAREQARSNIEVFERTDCDWIVTNSAGCGAGLRDYPAWFADEPAWRERAEAIAARVRDVTEVLAVALSQAGGTGVAAGINGLEGRVGYDAPCHLHHAQGVTAEPLEVLRAIPGLDVEALPSSERCCGGAGAYNLAHPEIAARVRAPKLGEVQRGGFDWIATGNPGCIMYLGAGLLRSGDRTPVVHPVELVDRAWS